jgi:hypothetical protein
MSRWAEAFRASIRSRDTVDSVDTSPPDRTTGPPTPPPCVNSVSGVAGPGHTKDAAQRLFGDELSTVSAVSCAANVVNTGASAWEPMVDAEGAISAVYTRAIMQRPPSWADSEVVPSPGSHCSCCKSQRWWREREAPKGWRCSTCHPPRHLIPDAVAEVRT